MEFFIHCTSSKPTRVFHLNILFNINWISKPIHLHLMQYSKLFPTLLPHRNLISLYSKVWRLLPTFLYHVLCKWGFLFHSVFLSNSFPVSFRLHTSIFVHFSWKCVPILLHSFYILNICSLSHHNLVFLYSMISFSIHIPRVASQFLSIFPSKHVFHFTKFSACICHLFVSIFLAVPPSHILHFNNFFCLSLITQTFHTDNKTDHYTTSLVCHN